MPVTQITAINQKPIKCLKTDHKFFEKNFVDERGGVKIFNKMNK